MKLFGLSISALGCFVLVNCAGMYKPPVSVAPVISTDVTGSKADILKAAKRVLVEEGFQIATSDESGGIISTGLKKIHAAPEQADCGTTMGIDYLKDNRTTTRVAIGIVADDGHFSVKATLEGEYMPGDASQNITLQCVSHGLIENDVKAKIMAAMPH